MMQPVKTQAVCSGSLSADITTKMLDITQENGLFLRDTVTGLCKSCLSGDSNGNISPKTAKIMWLTHFKDRIRMKTVAAGGEPRLKQLSTQDLDILWENIYMFSTYNSRKEMYEAIPEWDGTPRISSFLHDYFMCNANPNFFLLLISDSKSL